MPGKKRLFLHIGSLKTGTSAIQYFLLKNRDALKLNGITYPDHELDDNNVSSGNSSVLSILIQNDFLQAQEHCKNLLKTKEKTVVLSSEFLWQLNETHITKFRELLQDFDTKIIVYLRRADAWMTSAYNQTVKRRSNTATIIDWWPNNLDRLLQRNTVINNWREEFGRENIIVKPYEIGQFYRENIFSDFLKALDMELSEDFEIPGKPINISYSVDALEYKRVINHVLDDELTSNLVDVALQDYSANCATDNWPHSSLPPSDRIKIVELCAEADSLIVQEYLNRPDGRLFHDPLPDPLEEWQSYTLSKEDVQRINKFLREKHPDVLNLASQKLAEAKACEAFAAKIEPLSNSAPV